MVSSANVDAVAGGTATLRTKSGLRTCDDKQRWANFDPDHILRDERAQTSPEHFCTENVVTIIFNQDYDRIIFRNETVNLVSHVFILTYTSL